MVNKIQEMIDRHSAIIRDANITFENIISNPISLEEIEASMRQISEYKRIIDENNAQLNSFLIQLDNLHKRMSSK